MSKKRTEAEQRIDTQRTDNVSGVIVGGDYVSWQLFYDERPQGSKEYAETDEAATLAARQKHATLMRKYSGFPCYLYPGDKWEIRLWP